MTRFELFQVSQGDLTSEVLNGGRGSFEVCGELALWRRGVLTRRFGQLSHLLHRLLKILTPVPASELPACNHLAAGPVVPRPEGAIALGGLRGGQSLVACGLCRRKLNTDPCVATEI